MIFFNKRITKVLIRLRECAAGPRRCCLQTPEGKFQGNSVHVQMVESTLYIYKSKNTLRVEINQFCDGKRDTMRSSYAIDKM